MANKKVTRKDNFEMVDVKVSKAKLDSKGNKVTELVKSKNGKIAHHSNHLLGCIIDFSE